MAGWIFGDTPVSRRELAGALTGAYNQHAKMAAPPRSLPATTSAQQKAPVPNGTGANAVTGGFEPPAEGCSARAFEARSFGRSDTSPLESLL